MKYADFVELLWREYASHRRDDLPWRQINADGLIDPYEVLVSEIMLQQTQVSRVIPKYQEFLAAFPTMEALAQASLGQVLQLWSGLGYGRRAKYLYDIARELSGEPFPRSIDELTSLKGIGVNTASAILTYAFNTKQVFVETNIRTVCMYHLHSGTELVSDSDIVHDMQQALEHVQPDEYRDFYWGLMDYGSYLKSAGVRNNAQSKQYAKQSKFEGSRRQVRGSVLRLLTTRQAPIARAELEQEIVDSRLASVLDELYAEGLLVIKGTTIHLP